MLEAKKILVRLPRPWKKSFNNAILIPVRMRHCGEFKGEIFSMTCIIKVNEN